jgi:peptidylprolyl isomerase
MPRSRRFRKNTDKPEWGKNNPQTKAKNQKMLMIVGALVVIIVVVSALLVVGGVFNAPAATPTPTPSPTPTAAPTIAPTTNPSATPNASQTPQPSATPATSPAGQYSATGTRILLQTSMGNITLQMRDDKPITTANFINIVEQGLYDGTTFHRVLANFMIQGGVVQQSLPTIADEIGTNNQNVIGTIAMANTGQPNSASSSFFINVVNNNNADFDSAYTVFGKVIGGMDVVNAIKNVPVTASPYMSGETSYPTTTITLIKAIVLP